MVDPYKMVVKTSKHVPNGMIFVSTRKGVQTMAISAKGYVGIGGPNAYYPKAKLNVGSPYVVEIFDPSTGKKQYKNKTFHYIEDCASEGIATLYCEGEKCMPLTLEEDCIILIKSTTDSWDRFIKLKSFVYDSFSTRKGLKHKMKCETVSNIEYLREVHKWR